MQTYLVKFGKFVSNFTEHSFTILPRNVLEEGQKNQTESLSLNEVLLYTYIGTYIRTSYTFFVKSQHS